MPADGRPAWCYGAIGWRLATRRRMSGLVVLTLKNAVFLVVTIVAGFVTVTAALRVARREGLLTPS